MNYLKQNWKPILTCLILAIGVYCLFPRSCNRNPETEQPSIFDQSKHHIDSLHTVIKVKDVQLDSIQKVLDRLLFKGTQIAVKASKLKKVDQVYTPEKEVKDSTELRSDCDSLYLLAKQKEALLNQANGLISELDSNMEVQQEIQSSKDSLNIAIQDSQLKTNVDQDKEITRLNKKLKRMAFWNKAKLIAIGAGAAIILILTHTI